MEGRRLVKPGHPAGVQPEAGVPKNPAAILRKARSGRSVGRLSPTVRVGDDMALKRSESFGDRRDQIIQASAELFEKVGYHGASMQMVADAVKLGKPTLYYYFKSKTDILYAVHES